MAAHSLEANPDIPASIPTAGQQHSYIFVPAAPPPPAPASTQRRSPLACPHPRVVPAQPGLGTPPSPVRHAHAPFQSPPRDRSPCQPEPPTACAPHHNEPSCPGSVHLQPGTPSVKFNHLLIQPIGRPSGRPDNKTLYSDCVCVSLATRARTTKKPFVEQFNRQPGLPSVPVNHSSATA